MEADLVDSKVQRLEDLLSTSTEIYEVMAGIRGIQETAARNGNLDAASEAAAWHNEASKLRDKIITAHDRESAA